MDLAKIFKDCEPNYYIGNDGQTLSIEGEVKLSFEDWVDAALLDESWSSEDQANYMAEWYECECGGCVDSNKYDSVCSDIELWLSEYNDDLLYAQALNNNNSSPSSDGSKPTLVVGDCKYSYKKIGLGLVAVFGAFYLISRK